MFTDAGQKSTWGKRGVVERLSSLEFLEARFWKTSGWPTNRELRSSLCAEHVQQPGGASPLPNLMEVKG